MVSCNLYYAVHTKNTNTNIDMFYLHGSYKIYLANNNNNKNKKNTKNTKNTKRKNKNKNTNNTKNDTHHIPLHIYTYRTDECVAFN